MIKFEILLTNLTGETEIQHAILEFCSIFNLIDQKCQIFIQFHNLTRLEIIDLEQLTFSLEMVVGYVY
jgi:hypothetical protein